jgi:hypothetical protein
MHPLDTLDRHKLIKEEFGVGYCNITRCCTEVCPESIGITDNAIIPVKERVADDLYDPVRWLLRKVAGGPKKTPATLPKAPAKTLAATPAARSRVADPIKQTTRESPTAKRQADEKTESED